MKEGPDPVTCAQMKEIEARAAESGLSYYQMMENAGTGAAEFIIGKENIEGKRVLVFCGKGNNGGDGFVVARRLFQAGAQVWMILPDGPPKTEDAIRNRDLCRSLHIAEIDTAEILSGLSSAKIDEMFPADIVVDAVYGTGFHGKLNEHIRDLLHAVNHSSGTKYALDIPSGLSGDSGEADEDTFRADYTLVFHRMKPAHLMNNAQKYCGQVVCIDIGIGRRTTKKML
jgi:NAD(P)H-hydrate epimerase